MTKKRDINKLVNLLPNKSDKGYSAVVFYNETSELVQECEEIHKLREVVNELNQLEFSFTSGT